ncbi:MAG: tRNA (guanosine(46)-N7)-methyltransferase TrmB [Rhodothermales bacterium]
MSILLNLSALSFPSTSSEIFGREGSLVAEIGVGSGGFIEAVAENHPHWNVLGIERAPQSVARTYRRLLRRRVSNARLAKADAWFVVRNVIAPGDLSGLFINFPDPWPRRKHQHRRLLSVPFLELLASRLMDGGRLALTTDHPEYLEYVKRNALATGLYEMESGEPPPEALETKYAQKWQSRELDIHHMIFTRTGIPAEFGVELELIDEMHHAVLEGDLPEPQNFERKTFPFRGGVAVVIETYRNLDGSGMAFLVHVEENELGQDVVIEARRGRNGTVLALKRFGETLHTRGVGEAVKALTGWLEGEGMRVVHRKY